MEALLDNETFSKNNDMMLSQVTDFGIEREKKPEMAPLSVMVIIMAGLPLRLHRVLRRAGDRLWFGS